MSSVVERLKTRGQHEMTANSLLQTPSTGRVEPFDFAVRGERNAVKSNHERRLGRRFALRLRAGALRSVRTLFLMCVSISALAQEPYPTKPVTFLIPFPPGGGNDIVGRIVANKISQDLHQRIVPDNRSGASGNIAIEAVRRAPPDGYMLVVASTSFSINMYMTKVSYTPADFTPVAMIGNVPFALVVAKSLPAKNIRALVDLLKAKPGQFNIAAGSTGIDFFLPEAFKKTAAVDIRLITYKGTGDGMIDLLGERTQMMFAPMSQTLAYYRSGKVQMHGVTGSKRSPLVPEVPTFIEAGYPKLDIPVWFALLGPAGIPPQAVKVMSNAVAKALASKDVTDALVNQGVEPSYGSPASLEAFLKSDVLMWGALVKELGVKPQ
jgi:tripartite-type tricarboxylate transporter receptor subunit TctC